METSPPAVTGPQKAKAAEHGVTIAGADIIPMMMPYSNARCPGSE